MEWPKYKYKNVNTLCVFRLKEKKCQIYEQNVNRNTHSLVTCYFIKPHQFLFETIRLRMFIRSFLFLWSYVHDESQKKTFSL